MLLRNFTDPFAGHGGIYHFSMPHLEKTLLFENDRDYTVGVNYLAIVTLSNPVSLLCYCLMSNHFHLLLAGRLEDCVKFYFTYIDRMSRYLSKTRGLKGVLHKNNVDVQEVTSEKQFRNEVLYILRNPYKARISSPFSYPWCSVDAYFPFPPVNADWERSREMSLRRFRERFMTRNKSDAMDISEGRISNRCFVDYSYVEEHIGDSLVFFDTMRLYDLESVVESQHGIEETVTYSDSELKEKMTMVCRKEFYADSPVLLSRKDILSLARILARRYGARKKQIARLTGLSQEVLDTLL